MTLRPRILAILPGFIPSTITLVAKPLIALHRAGLISADITLEFAATCNQVKRADLVVFCRNMEPAYNHLLETALRFKKPVIYDLDDNFFDIPLTSEDGRYYRDPYRLHQLEQYLAHSSLVRVYSEPLRERVSVLNPRVEKMVSTLDWNLIPDAPPARKQLSKVTIVYATSRVNDNLAHIFLGDLMRLVKTYPPKKVEVHFLGYHPPELNNHPSACFAGMIRDYDQYLRKFYDQGYDIGLAPLLNDVFHRSKTNTKFREYGACGVAGIYSNVELYASCVKDGETGLLVPNEPGAWYEAMVRLVEDCGLRERIRERAQRYVRQHYSQENAQAVWWEQIQRVLAEKRTDTSARHPSAPALTVPSKDGQATTQRVVSATPVLLRVSAKARNWLVRLRAQGLRPALYTLGWHWSNLWMLFRYRLLTSPAADFLRRRRYRRPNT